MFQSVWSVFTASFLNTVPPQTDVQKILRNARKLPDKTQTFYKVSLTETYLYYLSKCFHYVTCRYGCGPARSWTVSGRLPWLSVSGSSLREWLTCWRENVPCSRTPPIQTLPSSSPMRHSSSNWPVLVTPSMQLMITTLFQCTQTSPAEWVSIGLVWTKEAAPAGVKSDCFINLHVYLDSLFDTAYIWNKSTTLVFVFKMFMFRLFFPLNDIWDDYNCLHVKFRCEHNTTLEKYK